MDRIGEDYFILIRPLPNDVCVILNYFKFYWKNAVVSDSNEHLYSIKDIDYNSLYEQQEFVIYKDEQAVENWKTLGYSEENSHTSLLIILEEDAICLTYNSEKESINLINSLEKAIFFNHNRSFRGKKAA